MHPRHVDLVEPPAPKAYRLAPPLNQQCEPRVMAIVTPPPAKTSNAAQLYADTVKIHPRAVRGTFRTIKWWAMVATLAFWQLAPFLRWDRGPGAPNQAILADMAGRRGYFFFLEIWPQEVYYLTGLLLLAALTLFLMSALAGRVWCGFLCWQTVYTDLFVAVERWIVGDRNVRIAMDRRKWDADKLLRRGAVTVIWLVIAAACGISFVLYFADAPTLIREIFAGTAGLAVYSAIAIVGGFCFLLAGWGREQVCIYMCPYARFQSAMFDEHSLIISYEAWRGDPRAPARKGQSFEGRGHCVDCRMCVQSCPTGIDIRDGNQLACIGCGLCIDACDSVMDKYGLPRGLISYDSVVNQQGRGRGEKTRFRIVRPRTIVYAGAVAVVAIAMTASLVTRRTTEVDILHERSPLYVQLGNGSIRNGYTYKVLNMVRKDRAFTLSVADLDGAELSVVGDEGHEHHPELDVAADSVGTFRVYVTAPQSSTKGKATQLYFILTDKADGSQTRNKGLFAGPDSP